MPTLAATPTNSFSVGQLVTTAIVSAVFASLVALVIELFAKPRLEAKKDRVLEQARAKRELGRLCRLAGGKILLYHHSRSHQVTNKDDPARLDLLDLRKQIDELLISVSPYLANKVAYTVSWGIDSIWTITHPRFSRPEWTKEARQQFAHILTSAGYLVDCPWWAFRQRRNAYVLADSAYTTWVECEFAEDIYGEEQRTVRSADIRQRF